jgi:hypothetical protein
MANFGDFRGSYDKMISLLKQIARSLQCIACENTGTLTAQTSSAGTGDIDAGFKSIAIVKTNDTGTVTITLSDSSVYTLTEEGEGFSDASSPGFSLPAYDISSADGGTWKWHGLS